MGKLIVRRVELLDRARFGQPAVRRHGPTRKWYVCVFWIRQVVENTCLFFARDECPLT